VDRVRKAVRLEFAQTGLSNTRAEMGDSALVEANGVEILLCSLRNQAMGTDLFTGIGCDLAAKRIVVVKSSQHFHASYSKVASHVIYAAAPGAVTLDVKTLPYKKVRRPKWPLDA
jgi:microcystin degradation protein MlrC